MTTDVPDYDSLDGAPVVNDLDEDLGTVEGLFVDDTSAVPTWVAVRSGLFGRHHSLVPLAQSRWDGGKLFVPYSRDDLAAAPHGDPDEQLDAAREQALFEHYNVGYSDHDRPGPHTGVEATDTGLTGDPGAGSHPVEFGSSEVEAAAAAGVPGLPTVPGPDPAGGPAAPAATRLRPYRGAA